ncbi:MAG: chaperone modulator CbpM [Burkholderiaceae bacterium]
MSEIHRVTVQAVLVEEEVQFTLDELCRLCGADSDQLVALVQEGVLPTSGDRPEVWRFGGSSLPRARAATRLTRDLELNAAAAALVLDLLDEIDALRSQLRRHGHV